MNDPSQSKPVEITVAGKKVIAKEGETLIHALWSAGMAREIATGCDGGVCGACTVSLRYSDGRKGGTDLACMKIVEEGMQVFPFPVEMMQTKPPVANPTADKLRVSYPTLDRCTKCESCTYACPMDIPVMDSVLRMQKGELTQVSEDFTTCIHCGLCRAVCEDRVEPHHMGMWVRRSLGKSMEGADADPKEPVDEALWAGLTEGTLEERLNCAKEIRAKGKIK